MVIMILRTTNRKRINFRARQIHSYQEKNLRKEELKIILQVLAKEINIRGKVQVVLEKQNLMNN